MQIDQQVGETYGDYNQIVQDEEFQEFSQHDKGYLIQFENENEARFLSKNNIFQKIMWQQNFFGAESDDPICTTLRLDPGYPEE